MELKAPSSIRAKLAGSPPEACFELTDVLQAYAPCAALDGSSPPVPLDPRLGSPLATVAMQGPVHTQAQWQCFLELDASIEATKPPFFNLHP